MRKTARDVTIAGHHIPTDTLVATAPAVNHFDDTVWTEPDAFDPDRFTAARADDRAHRFSWIPFGGGAHKCIGLRFGTLDVTAILHELLHTHTWSINDRYTVPWDYTSLPVPVDGLPRTLSRRPDVPHSRAIQFP